MHFPINIPRLLQRGLKPFMLLMLLAPLAVQAAGNVNGLSNGPIPDLKISSALSLATPQNPPQVDLWDRIRAGMQLDGRDNDLVQVHENWFIGHPRALDLAIQRSRLYLFHIVLEVENRDMPTEIALLPMIESAFNPNAESPRAASGLWQFIPSTGKVFGLKQNGWYDGRRDVLEATRAALDYLQTLKGMFGSWELALAAYNCGEGCVGRAIERNKARGLPTDYASLALPTETRHYVPKLIAVSHMIKEPERFGLALDAMPNEPYFVQVNLKHPMDAKTAIRLAEMSEDDFMSLNPGYRRKVIYTDTPGVLLLPTERIETFHFNLQRADKSKARLTPYEAQKGDTLQKIANRFDINLAWLKELNPVKTHRGKLASNQKVLVPIAAVKSASSASSDPVKPAEKTAKATPAKKKMLSHRVRKGDTLSSVARHYKVSLADLRRVNAHSHAQRKRLMPGDELLIPVENS